MVLPNYAQIREIKRKQLLGALTQGDLQAIGPETAYDYGILADLWAQYRFDLLPKEWIAPLAERLQLPVLSAHALLGTLGNLPSFYFIKSNLDGTDRLSGTFWQVALATRQLDKIPKEAIRNHWCTSQVQKTLHCALTLKLEHTLPPEASTELGHFIQQLRQRPSQLHHIKRTDLAKAPLAPLAHPNCESAVGFLQIEWTLLKPQERRRVLEESAIEGYLLLGHANYPELVDDICYDSNKPSDGGSLLKKIAQNYDINLTLEPEMVAGQYQRIVKHAEAIYTEMGGHTLELELLKAWTTEVAKAYIKTQSRHSKNKEATK